MRKYFEIGGLVAAAILPLATSYNICEGLGFESETP